MRELDNAPPKNLRLGKRHPVGRGAFVDDGGFADEAQFFAALSRATGCAETTLCGESVGLTAAICALRDLCRKASGSGNKVIFIGNGGSSAIASHMAVDWTKNGVIRSIAFNDAPTLTCLANDFGYPAVFAKQLEYYALNGDVVIIVSSSGHSSNIMRAAEQAFTQGLDLVTLSGMNPDNILRQKGLLAFYVPAMDYGIVEIAHLALLHSVVSVRRPD
ncbi:MAG: SIS domain-containing protein [Burkholderiales bacterium]